MYSSEIIGEKCKVNFRDVLNHNLVFTVLRIEHNIINRSFGEIIDINPLINWNFSFTQ